MVNWVSLSTGDTKENAKEVTLSQQGDRVFSSIPHGTLAVV